MVGSSRLRRAPRLLDGEGHLSILLGAYGRLLDDLVEIAA
jgi:hypothetical protein